MKYKIGDRVLEESKLDLLFNPYHKERFSKTLIEIVTEADGEHFSIYKPSGRHTSAIKQGLTVGSDAYMVFRQSNGKTVNWASKKRLLHLEEDKDYIVKKIRSIGSRTFLEKKNRLLSQIETTQALLEVKKNEYESDLQANFECLWGRVEDEEWLIRNRLER